VRPTARNAERFERFALLDLDATRRRDPEWYDAFSAYTTARAKDRHAKATMRQLIRAGTKQVPDAELRTIDVPTALLWGRDDRMAPLQLAEGVATRLGWPLYIVDGAAHVPHIEQPGSFLSALSDATRRPSTRSTS
jgi:pimeloyl-ACP methyl ester carboxylesterase